MLIDKERITTGGNSLNLRAAWHRCHIRAGHILYKEYMDGYENPHGTNVERVPRRANLPNDRSHQRDGKPACHAGQQKKKTLRSTDTCFKKKKKKAPLWSEATIKKYAIFHRCSYASSSRIKSRGRKLKVPAPNHYAKMRLLLHQQLHDNLC